MKAFKRCLAITIAVTFLFHPLSGYSAPLGWTEADKREWQEIDKVLQKEYESLLSTGVLPSEARQILYEEFEAYGCNGRVVEPALDAHQKNRNTERGFADPSYGFRYIPLEKEELTSIYALGDYSSECASTIALAEGIESGEINVTNFLPEKNSNYDRQRALGPIAKIIIQAAVAGVAGAATAYLLENDEREVREELRELRAEVEVLRNRTLDLQSQLSEANRQQREELIRKQQELKREEERLRKREDVLQEKLKEVNEKLEAIRGESNPPSDDEPPMANYCIECAEFEREQLWKQFKEQVKYEAVTCASRGTWGKERLYFTEPLQFDSPFTRTIGVSPMTALQSKTCDKDGLKKSLQNKMVSRFESLCNLHVETVNECQIRIQQEDPLGNESNKEKNDFLMSDCKLHAYPHTWKIGEPPIMSVDDCRYIQKRASTLGGGDSRSETQEKDRPYVVLGSEECHPEIAKEFRASNPQASQLTAEVQIANSAAKVSKAAAAAQAGKYDEAAAIFAEIDSERNRSSSESKDYLLRSNQIASDSTLSPEEKEKEQCLLDQQMWAMEEIFGDLPSTPGINKN